jgi:hypothetical protein
VLDHEVMGFGASVGKAGIEERHEFGFPGLQRLRQAVALGHVVDAGPAVPVRQRGFGIGAGAVVVEVAEHLF